MEVMCIERNSNLVALSLLWSVKKKRQTWLSCLREHQFIGQYTDLFSLHKLLAHQKIVFMTNMEGIHEAVLQTICDKPLSTTSDRTDLSDDFLWNSIDQRQRHKSCFIRLYSCKSILAFSCLIIHTPLRLPVVQLHTLMKTNLYNHGPTLCFNFLT